ncbi:guanylate kinase [Chloroflexota bacterium]
MNSSPLLIVISGPSGVGKDTVIGEIKKRQHNIHHTVTCTTRAVRTGESDGVDYHFVSEDQFKQTINEGGFLEWAEVYGNLYGTPKPQIRQALKSGLDVIAKVDVQGAISIKEIVPDALYIWISAPSLKKLDERLKKRNSDSQKDIELRIETAHREIESVHIFDYVVINEEGHPDKAASQILNIMAMEKNKAMPRHISL